MRIRILFEAIHDLELGADFYESHAAGLGGRFVECLVAQIELLKVNAGIHERVHGSFRCLARTFPFAIYYQLNGDCVEVLAVLDCRQDPAAIEERLQRGRPDAGRN